jgi:hypothetical protein
MKVINVDIEIQRVSSGGVPIRSILFVSYQTFPLGSLFVFSTIATVE